MHLATQTECKISAFVLQLNNSNDRENNNSHFIKQISNRKNIQTSIKIIKKTRSGIISKDTFIHKTQKNKTAFLEAKENRI